MNRKNMTNLERSRFKKLERELIKSQYSICVEIPQLQPVNLQYNFKLNMVSVIFWKAKSYTKTFKKANDVYYF